MITSLFFAFLRWVILGSFGVAGYLTNLAMPEKPWEERRGLAFLDYNNNLLLIRASVSQVAETLSDRTDHWEQDVVGREVLLGMNGNAFIFRLRGHSWTIVVCDDFGFPSSLGISAEILSRRLETRVIEYWRGDTSGTIGYDFFENGRQLEEFNATEGDGGAPDEGSTFSSQLRKLRREDIRNIWSFTHAFFVAQDALEPGISFTWFLERRPGRPYQRGERVRIVSPTSVISGDGKALTMPAMERVDYLALKAPPRP